MLNPKLIGAPRSCEWEVEEPKLGEMKLIGLRSVADMALTYFGARASLGKAARAAPFKGFSSLPKSFCIKMSLQQPYRVASPACLDLMFVSGLPTGTTTTY